MIEIRPVSSKELAEVWAMEKELFPDAWSEKALKDHFDNPFSVCFLCFSDGIPASYLIASQMDEEGEILRIGTLPNFRRRGLASRLLTHFFQNGIASGMTRVFLEVREANRSARGLYESLGFLSIGIRKAYYRFPSDNAVLYQKNLEKDL